LIPVRKGQIPAGSGRELGSALEPFPDAKKRNGALQFFRLAGQLFGSGGQFF